MLSSCLVKISETLEIGTYKRYLNLLVKLRKLAYYSLVINLVRNFRRQTFIDAFIGTGKYFEDWHEEIDMFEKLKDKGNNNI